MAQLSQTARVILGMLAFGEKTGYEIKALVDDSMRFFWPASYARIYPELMRLQEAGLVRSREDPRGARPRRLFTLTAPGRKALEDWLTSAEESAFELRDEGLLKFFFSDALPREAALANLRAMRARHERTVATLRELEPVVEEDWGGFPHLTLQGGIELHSLMADWCRRTETQLSGGRRARSGRRALRRR
jgi:PadR family transcriptional regulator, regulatory protein AphA